MHSLLVIIDEMFQENKLTELIAQCKNGENKAQYSIFNLKKDEFFAICKRYASNSLEAEDMLIEGFTKIFHHIHSFSDGNFNLWARRIIINTCINAYHKNKRREEFEITTDEFYETFEIESEKQFSYDDLQHCLEQLSDSQRIAFNLYAIDDYKPREIAEILQINDETVRTLIHRSKIKLRKLLTELDQRRRL